MAKKQDTIFGEEATADELSFIRPHEEYKQKENLETGMDFAFGRIHFNPDKGSITIFGTDDRENQAVGVFLEHHPEAKFKDSKPDGVRFIGALARFHGLIGTCQEICDGHNENHTTGQVLNVKKTDKGILWTINAGGV